jgi:hypothetical protein
MPDDGERGPIRPRLRVAPLRWVHVGRICHNSYVPFGAASVPKEVHVVDLGPAFTDDVGTVAGSAGCLAAVNVRRIAAPAVLQLPAPFAFGNYVLAVSVPFIPTVAHFSPFGTRRRFMAWTPGRGGRSRTRPSELARCPNRLGTSSHARGTMAVPRPTLPPAAPCSARWTARIYKPASVFRRLDTSTRNEKVAAARWTVGRGEQPSPAR